MSSNNQEQTYPTIPLLHLQWLGLCLAVCSISYELLMAKTLVMLAGSDILWLSITIGIYVAALGLGTYFYGQRKKRQKEKDPESLTPRFLARLLFRVEIALSLVGTLSVSLILLYHYYYRVYLYRSNMDYDLVQNWGTSTLVAVIVLCLLVTAMIGIFSGYELPVLLDLASAQDPTQKSHTGAILGFTYFGNLVGTWLFSLVLLPKLGVVTSAICIGSLNLFLCYYLISRPLVDISLKRGLMITAAAGALCLALAYTSTIKELYLKGMYESYSENYSTSDLISDIKRPGDISRFRSLYQVIDIIPVTDSKTQRFKNVRRQFELYLDGHFQLNTVTEHIYHEMMAHFPVQALGRIPKNILVLGAGDGMLIRELLKYGDRVESITHIELDLTMYNLARYHPLLREYNQSSMHHPKVKTILMDAFYYLRNTKTKYDAIYIDFPFPFSYDLSKLYSLEFYRYVQSRLKPNGYVMIDAYLDRIKKWPNNVTMSTLQYAGLKYTFPLICVKDSETYVLAVKHKVELSFKFKPNGIKYRFLNQKMLTEQQYWMEPYKVHKKWIHSIFWPKLMKVQDEFF